PLPKAYVVDGIRPALEPDSLTLLSDPRFDPRHEVVVAADLPARAPTPGYDATARVVRRSANVVEVEAELSAPALLVLVEAFRPGWEATVDGARAEVLRANVVFRGVPLAAGRHHVVFRYRPVAVPVGAAVTVACVLGGLGLARHARRSAAASSAAAS